MTIRENRKPRNEKEGKKLALPMKSYKTLPSADFDALVAYLQSLSNILGHDSLHDPDVSILNGS